MNIEAIKAPYGASVGLVMQLISDYEWPNYRLGYQFKHVKDVLGNNILNKLSSNNITVGIKYGPLGVDPRAAISNPDEDYFEICARQLLATEPRIANKLFKKCKLIINDYNDGGLFLHTVLDRYAEQLETAREVVFAHSIYNLHLDTKWKTMYIPVYIASGGAYYLREDTYQSNVQIKDMLMAVHKPRNFRLEALSYFEEHDLLDNTDWSLFVIDPTDVTRPGDFHASPSLVNIAFDKKDVYTERSVQFIKRHETTLPKKLDMGTKQVVDFWDHMLLPEEWKNYKWYVDVETYIDEIFVTEKTIKGFVLGLPTMVIGSPGTVQHLKDLGFKLEGNYDVECFEDKMLSIVDHIKNNTGDKDIALHNKQLISDVEFLSDLYANPLIGLAPHTSVGKD